MGFLDSLFGGSGEPNDKKIASTAAVLNRRHGEPAIRYQAADKLVAWRTPAAIDALLKRFTVNVASETSDDEEKAYVAEQLEKIGPDVIPCIERYLRREGEVAWPLRLLGKLVGPDDFRDKVVAALSTYDLHFDRQPQRKVEAIEALRPHSSRPEVAAAVAPFLEDTDDTVRIAAADLVAESGREEDVAALVEALLASADRPRVRAGLAAALARHGHSVKGRKADVEPLLPEGYYLTREGGVKRLGK